MKIKPDNTVSVTMLDVWSKTWSNIDEAQADTALWRSWQSGRLAVMIGTTELSKLLGCGVPHASEIRNGTRNLTTESRQLVEKYLRMKVEHQK